MSHALLAQGPVPKAPYFSVNSFKVEVLVEGIVFKNMFFQVIQD
jgi:hypothetical protein